MKSFKDKYNNYFNNVNLENDKCLKIKNNIINKKKNPPSILKPVTISLILCLVFAGTVFGKDIINKIKKVYVVTSIERKDGTIGHTCLVDNAILETFNNKEYENNKKDEYATSELRKIMGVNILSSPIYGEEKYKLNFTKELDGKLAFASFSAKEIKAKELYELAYDISKIRLSFSFLTNNAPDEMKKAGSAFDEKNEGIEAYNFEIGNCDDKNFDIYHIESLDTDLYIYKVMEDMSFMYNKSWNSEAKIESLIFAFFEYEGVKYMIHGDFVSRDMIKNFTEILK